MGADVSPNTGPKVIPGVTFWMICCLGVELRGMAVGPLDLGVGLWGWIYTSRSKDIRERQYVSKIYLLATRNMLTGQLKAQNADEV